jgi:hypothetical protein
MQSIHGCFRLQPCPVCWRYARRLPRPHRPSRRRASYVSGLPPAGLSWAAARAGLSRTTWLAGPGATDRGGVTSAFVHDIARGLHGFISVLVRSCSREDSNLRPSAPETDPTRLPGSTAVHGMPTLGAGTCCLTCDFRPQRSIAVQTRP